VLGLLLASVVAGAVAGAALGRIAGLLVGAAALLCGAPFALIGAFVRGQVSYAQDRADRRAALESLEREARELAREARDLERAEREPPVFNDNRQVHIHNR
jgi:hypothetical protein